MTTTHTSWEAAFEVSVVESQSLPSVAVIKITLTDLQLMPCDAKGLL
jgi:hypothetical protein